MGLARPAERPPTSLDLASDASRDGVGTASWPAAAARAVARALLASIPAVPLAILLPSGEEVGNRGSPVARLRFADMRTLLGLLCPGSDLHFGDAYADRKSVV